MTLVADNIGRRAAGRWLLANVSLTIAAGERLALVGPSGSGKTLLLRSLALLDPADEGEIRWQGERVHGHRVPAFRSRVIYLHQRPALAEGTVEANLRQPFEFGVHRARQFDRGRIVAALEALGRGEAFLAKHQRDLSGGEAQLTALLRAMQLDPDMLLLDEPTAALDADATKLVETLVANWQQERTADRATVWVSHDAEQARRVGSRIVHLKSGRLEEADG